MLPDDGPSAGLVRADGTATPALRAAAAVAAFVDRNRARLRGAEPAPVVVLVPTSHLLSAPGPAGDALSTCIRTAARHLRLPLRAVGEYDLERLGSPGLILLPYPRALRQEAWDALLDRARAGACLLISGPVDHDAYWRPCGRLSELGIRAGIAPVAGEESLSVGGRPLRLRFGGDKAARVDKAVVRGQPGEVVVVPYGSGKVLFAPLPIELADERGPLAELYEWAVGESGVEGVFTIEPRDAPLRIYPLVSASAVLYALASRTDREQEVVLRHRGQGAPLPVVVPAGRAVLLLVDRASGAVLDRCEPEP